MERLDAFMARANAAYYAQHDPFKDFTTAPEITQVFGELLGAWAAVIWDTAGRPDPVALVECGPGRGTLMADALRAVARVAPEFHAAHELHFIETSPRLRAEQAARHPAACWHDSLDTVPALPFVLLANEFLDALPIRQFVQRGEGWHERFVCDAGFVELPAEPPGSDAQPGEVIETCEAARAFIRLLAGRLSRTMGAALFLDYGPTHPTAGDSLQAIRNGSAAPPLQAPGTADLTAHVDFASLARIAAASGAAVHGPVPQGRFLTRLGLLQRTFQLARHPPQKAQTLRAASGRLAEPASMGRLFKAFAICHPSLPSPPGFTA